jgi:hypothetical protein
MIIKIAEYLLSYLLKYMSLNICILQNIHLLVLVELIIR